MADEFASFARKCVAQPDAEGLRPLPHRFDFSARAGAEYVRPMRFRVEELGTTYRIIDQVAE